VATQEVAVSTVAEQMAASQNPSILQIAVRGHVVESPSFHLSPGQSLRGEDDLSGIMFASEAEGVQLSSDNTVRDIHLHTAPDKRAIFNDTSVDGLGRIELRGVTATGRVQTLARDRVRSGHVDVHGLDIVAADARGIEISGGLKTNGSSVPPTEQHGIIATLRIAGGCVAAGGGFGNI
jgi:hypothetical protein